MCPAIEEYILHVHVVQRFPVRFAHPKYTHTVFSTVIGDFALQMRFSLKWTSRGHAVKPDELAAANCCSKHARPQNSEKIAWR